MVTAAPNFAYEWAAQRGRPEPGRTSLWPTSWRSSEPVSMAAIDAFSDAFAPYGLPATAMKPSYGIAEATLFIASIPPAATAGDVLRRGIGWPPGRRSRCRPIRPTR